MLLIGSVDHSPRARYALHHLLGRMTGWRVAIAASEEEFRSSDLPKLRYGASDDAADNTLTIHASGAMGHVGDPGFNVPVGTQDGSPVLFPSPQGDDPVAGAFHLLSRSEEILPHLTDAHGRLPAGEHLVVQHKIAQQPVVDQWMWRIVGTVRAVHPGLPEPSRRYRHVVSVDLDNGLMVLGRPPWKKAAAIARELLHGRVSEAMLRMRVLGGAAPDPFDRYDVLNELARSGKADRVIAFALMRGQGRFDHAADHRHPLWRERLAEMNGSIELGLHPSYESMNDEAIAREDRQRLEGITGEAPTLNRRHFLRWRVPDTLRYLANNRFTEDHSLGFSDRPGFRAGTCTPFPWYDLEREEETPLMLWPFAVMDSALHDHLGMSSSEAIASMCAMSDAVREVKGTFVSVWHDRFLSGHGPWKGWPEAFHAVSEHAAP